MVTGRHKCLIWSAFLMADCYDDQQTVEQTDISDFYNGKAVGALKSQKK